MPGHVAYDRQPANAGELICANRKARGYDGQPLGLFPSEDLLPRSVIRSPLSTIHNGGMDLGARPLAVRCAAPAILFRALYHHESYSVSLTDQVWAGFSPDFTWQQGQRSIAKL
jgi:hypothetical protein